jgi:hypothetical protein
MFTTTQIGAVALFALSTSKDVLALPLLASRQNATSSIGNFGSCSVPQIKFGVGFDNRKETSFEPADQTSYPHGSADNIDIITQFMCDQLVNACNADATAKATCATATTAADGQTAQTGAQADAFNAVFGITTNFATVSVVSDQGVTEGVDGTATAASGASASAAAAVTSSAAAAASAPTDAASADPCLATVTVTVSNAAAASTSAASVAAAGAATATNSSTGAAAAAVSNATSDSATAANSSTGAAATASNATSDAAIGNFGSCSVPQIEFGTGFDNRKETAFQPLDQTSYNHGSADNIAVITQFMCNTLTNTCNADATAKATCAQAQTAANNAQALTGAQADAFNAVFGITTDFSAVPVVSNTGVTQSAPAASATAA